ncbi:MAG: hypothetical protein JW836_04920 [Deltaproteobacteria bacterium]|nr:hypothetical protein [Deltaproteobacteria bacterium]
MINPKMEETLCRIARFYDQRKVGDVGCMGFRRSSNLKRLVPCLSAMINEGLLIPGSSSFLDMGCADGRVNVLLSYLTKISVGVELDEWTLDDYSGLRQELDKDLAKEGFFLVPRNIFLFHGDTMDPGLHERVFHKTGLCFDAFDLFYTYLTMQEEFAALINQKAKKGAVFMVYGLEKILPRFRGLHLLTPGKPFEGILALYRKE